MLRLQPFSLLLAAAVTAAALLPRVVHSSNTSTTSIDVVVLPELTTLTTASTSISTSVLLPATLAMASDTASLPSTNGMVSEAGSTPVAPHALVQSVPTGESTTTSTGISSHIQSISTISLTVATTQTITTEPAVVVAAQQPTGPLRESLTSTTEGVSKLSSETTSSATPALAQLVVSLPTESSSSSSIHSSELGAGLSNGSPNITADAAVSAATESVASTSTEPSSQSLVLSTPLSDPSAPPLPASTFTSSTIEPTLLTSAATSGIATPLSVAGVSTTPLSLPTSTAGVSAQSSGTAQTQHDSTTSQPISTVGLVMGTLVGGAAFLGIVIFVLWRNRRRKRMLQSALLSPASWNRGDPSEKYEIDGESLGPSPRGAKFKAQTVGFFTNIRKTIVGVVSTILPSRVENGDTPKIDLDKGTSQFLKYPRTFGRFGSADRDVFGNSWDNLVDVERPDSQRGQAPGGSGNPFSDSNVYSGRNSPQVWQTPAVRTQRPASPLNAPVQNMSRPFTASTLNPFADPAYGRSNLTSTAMPSSSSIRFPFDDDGRAPSGQYTSRAGTAITPTPRTVPTVRTDIYAGDDHTVSPLETDSDRGRGIKGRSDPFDLERAMAAGLSIQPSPFSSRGIAKGVPMAPRQEVPRLGGIHQRKASDAPSYGSSRYSGGSSVLDTARFTQSSAGVDPVVLGRGPPTDTKGDVGMAM